MLYKMRYILWGAALLGPVMSPNVTVILDFNKIENLTGKGGNLIILLDIKSVRNFFPRFVLFSPQKGENTGKIRIVLPKWFGHLLLMT